MMRNSNAQKLAENSYKLASYKLLASQTRQRVTHVGAPIARNVVRGISKALSE